MTHAECGRDYTQSLTTKRPLAAQLTPLTLPDELNSFYARFQLRHTSLLERTSSTENTASALVITEKDVWVVFKRINIREAARSDGIPGRVLKACADQLAGVFTNIFNLSLFTGIVPTSSVIIPVPKKGKATCPIPIALTPIVSK